MLATTLYDGDPAAPALLIAHGLFGSARNWNVIATRLAGKRRVVTVDMRNHGQSPWFESHGYEDLAADLAEVIEAEGAPMDLLGHSMGGKAAMMLALTRPELLRRLIVADIAPTAYSHTQGHLITAMRGLDLAGLTSRSEADRRLSGSIEDPGTRAFLLQSLDLKADPPHWRFNLDALEAEMSKIVGWPHPEGDFAGPALFLTGAESDYVTPEHRPEIKARFPQARFARIPGAGHWLHADKPRAFEATVEAYLSA
ncbi:alpha/beta fold hydrolase [Vannielia litorea]|uniref:Pimeloyl-ACP methyl ester carboxylesterase n=1 Tax=Vannielia litorea TaxID=1217970 RepID=A0A1N6EF10_9RHOB|nr:alpha/beta fold hydrolase [Vannielia litorea]SIN81487.1 Pimeloyl-ACP methyl ester carboxylesterase [Vannielia litorea]